MKKNLLFLILLLSVLYLLGCERNVPNKTTGSNGSNTVQSVLEQQMGNTGSPETKNKKADETSVDKKQNKKETDATYDVDLTKLSSTMIYSEVYNMMVEPESYIGKSVRIYGQFAIYQATDETGKLIPGQIYFACLIADATACCSQGLEFVLAREHVYPDDYPELGTEIVVSGIFDTYDEDGILYCHLTDAKLE